jgi:hypothetical protein
MGGANGGLGSGMSSSRPLRFLLVVILASCTSASPLDPAMRSVEQIRGLKFTRPVRNVTIDRADLPAHLRKQMERSMPYSVEEWSSVLKALQLVDLEPGEVLPRLLDLYQSQVLAFYDPQTHTYYSIRQLPEFPPEMTKLADPKLLEETVMVHELTHALQDQHFGLAAREKSLRHDTDASLAYHAVLEGEAVLVMIAHVLAKMGVSLDEAIRDDATLGMLTAAVQSDQMIDASTPRYFAEMLKFPYLEGMKFVVAAYRRGGWKELDRIHANPPRTTREILNPEEYFSRSFVPQPFDASKPEGAITVEHLGAFHWSFLVGAENARGWVTDRAVVGRDGTVSVQTRWGSSDNASAFATAYAAFLRGRGLEPAVERNENVVTAEYVAR